MKDLTKENSKQNQIKVTLSEFGLIKQGSQVFCHSDCSPLENHLPVIQIISHHLTTHQRSVKTCAN